MTIGYYYKEYEINGTTYYVARYADKPDFVKFWEYGIVYPDCTIRLKGDLLSRPNLKRIFG